MLPIEKNKQIMQQMGRVLRRMEHLKQVKQKLFQFAVDSNRLYDSSAQNITRDMREFQENILRKTLYSKDKSNYLINIGKIYRQFAMQLQKSSKISVIKIDTIKHDQIESQQSKLVKQCQRFMTEFKQYMTTEQEYNKKYNHYNISCNQLDDIILRYRSYENPLSFYNQTMTNEYQGQLDKHYHQSENKETSLMTDIQLLDQKRHWIGENIREISKNYVILLHNYLWVIQRLFECVVEPNKDQLTGDRNKLNLRSSDNGSLDQPNEIERLNTLYSAQMANSDNLLEEYSQLFKKSFSPNEINSDYKFFHDRCENICRKKIQSSEQIYKLQMMMVQQLGRQKERYSFFEKEAKTVQKNSFNNNGVDSFKKRFRKYFGSNFHQIAQVFFAVVQRHRKSMEKIAKSSEDIIAKLTQLLVSKKNSIDMFQKRTKTLLEEHQKIKEKTYSRGSVDGQELQRFKNNIKEVFNQIKKVLMQLQKSEGEVDKMFFQYLKGHNDIILKQIPSRSMSRLLEKEKNRVNILRGLNLDSQIVLIVKEDSRYEMLLNQCPKPTLYNNFQSKIQKKNYEQTKKLLQLKEVRQKNMLRPRRGCCGITSSEPVKKNVLSSHKCKLLAQESCKGELYISAQGLIFEESTWFSDGLRLVIPQSDINKFDTKRVGEKEVVEIGTDFGELMFQSSGGNQIIQSMQKNITFRPTNQKDNSQKSKRHDSTSFLKNNTSTQYRISYDKNLPGTGNSNIQAQATQKLPNVSNKKPQNIRSVLVKKWKETKFLSQNFAKVVKELPEKPENRRDYSYKQGHSKFYLKERIDSINEGKDIVLSYQWKISFPESPMLHSFKHAQRVKVENLGKDTRIRFMIGRFCEDQLYIRNKFYKQVQEMNQELSKFIVNTLEREADVIIEMEDDESKSIDSCNIVIEELAADERDSNFVKTDNLRNSRLQNNKKSSFVGFNSSNGFKTSP